MSPTGWLLNKLDKGCRYSCTNQDVPPNSFPLDEWYPARLDFSEDLLFNRNNIRSALQPVGLDASTLDDPYPLFDPLKALQSLRVAMLGSSAAMLASAVCGTGSVNTPGGRASGTSEYGSSTNRFSGWGTLPGSLGHGVVADNTFRNGGQYGSRGGMADSQSMSSLSMDDSIQSVPNTGSASDLEREEMTSFKRAQQILHESPETRRRRKYAETMRMASPSDNTGGKGAMNFNELCALHKERAQTQRFNITGVFNDLSNELNRRKTSAQRRVSLNAPGLAFLRGASTRGSEKPYVGAISEQPPRREENSVVDSSELVIVDGQVDKDGHDLAKKVEKNDVEQETPNGGAQSNWDSNFISLFVS
ncbi:hypothetical protein Aperf_G00000017127 [Anoplocephala perfoliata]